MRFPHYSQYFPSPCFLHILPCNRLFTEQIVLFSFLSTTLPRDDSLQWHYEELQRLFNTDDSAHVTPGRCDFFQGGVVPGYGRAGDGSAAAMLLPAACADFADYLGFRKWCENGPGEVYFRGERRWLPRTSLFARLALVHWRMFPKMGSCVSERVRVSLVKEASDTGGIPSPRELRFGFRSEGAPVRVRLVTSTGKVL